MADADVYESLPESTPLSVTCLAGATAGIAEHCVMFPVDSVKVKVATLSFSPILSIEQLLRHSPPSRIMPAKSTLSIVTFC